MIWAYDRDGTVVARPASGRRGVGRVHPRTVFRVGAVAAMLTMLAGPGSVNNATPPLSATDTSPGDLTGVACDTGFCHLGGAPISNRNAYGAGLAYVANP
jgi:hypothetical protein